MYPMLYPTAVPTMGPAPAPSGQVQTVTIDAVVRQYEAALADARSTAKVATYTAVGLGVVVLGQAIYGRTRRMLDEANCSRLGTTRRPPPARGEKPPRGMVLYPPVPGGPVYGPPSGLPRGYTAY